MLEREVEPIERLFGGLRLFVPDRMEEILQDVLVNIFDRKRADLGQDVNAERRKPTARFTITLQLRLTRVKSGLDSGGDSQPRRSTVRPTARLDWVFVGPAAPPRFGGALPRFGD